MIAIENINPSSNEIADRSVKALWKHNWPGLSKSVDIRHSVDTDEIVELAKQCCRRHRNCSRNSN